MIPFAEQTTNFFDFPSQASHRRRNTTKQNEKNHESSQNCHHEQPKPEWRNQKSKTPLRRSRMQKKHIGLSIHLDILLYEWNDGCSSWDSWT